MSMCWNCTHYMHEISLRIDICKLYYVYDQIFAILTVFLESSWPSTLDLSL